MSPGPEIVNNLAAFLAGHLVVSRAAAFPETAVVQSQNADTGCRHPHSKHIPQLSLRVALVQQ